MVQNWGSAFPRFVTMVQTGAVPYREGEGANREGEVKEEDPGSHGES